MPDGKLTRRNFLQDALTLSGAGLFGISESALGVERELSRRVRPLDPLVSLNFLRVGAECEAIRLKEWPKEAVGSMMYLAQGGKPFVRSIADYMERANTPTQVLSQGRRVYSGAGTRLAVGSPLAQRFVYVANHHLLCNIAANLDHSSLSDPIFDITTIDSRSVDQFPGDRHQILTSEIADTGVSNEVVLNSEVELCGVSETGSYKFVGTPFPVRFRISDRGDAPGKHTAFGLRLPSDFKTQKDSFEGMSGSPVTIQGTQKVVGVFCSYIRLSADDVTSLDPKFTPLRGSNVDILIFTGPDELRNLVDTFIA